MAKYAGPILILIFTGSQAFRDVYLGAAFQGVNFFLVMLMAFSLTAVVFGVITAWLQPDVLLRLRGAWSTLIWMNLTTALAWTCFFFSLKHQQPSYVNTLHSGMGPLTVVCVSAFGARLGGKHVVGRAEGWCYAGLGLSLAYLVWIALSGRSGLATGLDANDIAGALLPFVSGCSITLSLLLSKRLNDRGLNAEAVSAVRYVATIALAAFVCWRTSGVASDRSMWQWMILAAVTSGLVAAPLYVFQMGIERTPQLTTHVIRALGPVFVFAMELADQRIGYSGAILAGIIAYSIFAILANVSHGRAVAHMQTPREALEEKT